MMLQEFGKVRRELSEKGKLTSKFLGETHSFGKERKKYYRKQVTTCKYRAGTVR